MEYFVTNIHYKNGNNHIADKIFAKIMERYEVEADKSVTLRKSLYKSILSAINKISAHKQVEAVYEIKPFNHSDFGLRVRLLMVRNVVRVYISRTKVKTKSKMVNLVKTDDFLTLYGVSEEKYFLYISKLAYKNVCKSYPEFKIPPREKFLQDYRNYFSELPVFNYDTFIVIGIHSKLIICSKSDYVILETHRLTDRAVERAIAMRDKTIIEDFIESDTGISVNLDNVNESIISLKKYMTLKNL